MENQNNTKLSQRYPGWYSSFETGHKEIFFGREKETEEIKNKMLNEKAFVLHSKSGFGKTSLLNAGVIPELEEKGNVVIKVHLLGCQSSKECGTPFKMLNDEITKKIEELEGEVAKEGKKVTYPEFLQYEYRGIYEIWGLLKKIRHLQDYNKKERIYLIADQFETVFTYPINEVEKFMNGIKDVVLDTESIPQYAKDVEFKTEYEELVYEELPVSILFAIRSDEVYHLDDYPDMDDFFKDRFVLHALTEEGAKKAIVAPAKIEVGDYNSKPFEYEEEAVDEIIRIATQKEGIDATILQQIVSYCETEIVKNREGVSIKKKDINEDVILGAAINFALGKFGSSKYEYLKFIRERLISEDGKKRLPFYKEQATDKIDIKTLKDSRLVRDAANGANDVLELRHDRLVEKLVEKWEAEKGKRERLTKAKMWGISIAVSIFVVSLFFYFFDSWSSVKAIKEKNIAVEEKNKVLEEINKVLEEQVTFTHERGVVDALKQDIFYKGDEITKGYINQQFAKIDSISKKYFHEDTFFLRRNDEYKNYLLDKVKQ